MKDRLSDAIESYIKNRKSKNKAANTIQNDRVTLTQLLTFAGNIYVENITFRKVDEFFDDQADRGLQASTRATKHATLSAFFKWCVLTDRTTSRKNPMEGREAPKWHKLERRRFSLSQLPAFLAAAKSPRDRMYLALHAYTLCRTSEITDMRIEDLDLHTGFLHARIFKGRREDDLPITDELDAELRRWLREYSRLMEEPLQPRWRLVPAMETPRLIGMDGGRPIPDLTDRKPKPLAKLNNPHLYVQHSLEAIGFPLRDENGKSFREGTHTVRRSMARALYEEFRDEGSDRARDDVQSLLHHKTSAQTDDYIGLDTKKVSRNKRLRGKTMFPSLSASNVVPLKVVDEKHG